jgi:hypothetical protein
VQVCKGCSVCNEPVDKQTGQTNWLLRGHRNCCNNAHMHVGWGSQQEMNDTASYSFHCHACPLLHGLQVFENWSVSPRSHHGRNLLLHSYGDCVC